MGALTGGAIVVFLAPQSGEQTRSQIRKTGAELQQSVEVGCAEALKRIEAVVAEIHSKVQELSVKADHRAGLDMERLDRWREELSEMEEASAEALAEARME